MAKRRILIEVDRDEIDLNDLMKWPSATIRPGSKITPEEFADQMRQVIGSDIEINHHTADRLMCDVLRSLGYEEGVRIFNNLQKWYA